MKKMILVVLILALNLTAGIARAATDNQAPIADAGLPRYAGPDPVVLDGTGSYDPDGSGILSYTWQQISGPSVIIIDANTATPSIGGAMQPGMGRIPTPTLAGFVQTDEIQECEFELIVGDGELTSSPDTVKVVIVPGFGGNTLRLANDSFDPDKPTYVFFHGGNCVVGLAGQATWASLWPDWLNKTNIIDFPGGYVPDIDGNPRTYYACGDMIVVYLSSVAPDYKMPIQTTGVSTGGQPAVDVGIRLNLTYRDARYAVNHVTFFDATGYCRDYSESISTFLTSSVDGELCWIDNYVGTLAGAHPDLQYPSFHPNVLNVLFNKATDSSLPWLDRHGLPAYWYGNSFAGDEMNRFSNGVVAGAYWSVIGPGKNLQLASTPGVETYKFTWYGDEFSGYMYFYDEPNHPGRLPEPVTLIGPSDGDFVDANGAVLSCELSENAVGYQLLFGPDPYSVMDYYIVSDTLSPPSEVIIASPFEQTWWTVKVYDQYGSTIYADPIQVKFENLAPPLIENITTGQRYASVRRAVDNARHGNEIVVSPGVYQENIVFIDKNLTLRSKDPNDPNVVAATVIEGSPQGSVITLSSSGNGVGVLAGLTITGGTVGISCCDASPIIRNCTIGSNGSVAVEFWDGYEPTIIDCNILGQINQLIDPRLVSHWKLDETEGTIIYDSVSEIQANLFGDPVWQPTGGMVDGALMFDGIDDFVGTYSVPVQSDGQMSVFVWVKGGAPSQVIVSEFRNVSWLMADASQGYLKTDLKEAGDAAQPLVSEVTITDGEWHHVGLTWDGTNRVLYVDDISVASDTQTSLERSTMELNIGCGPYETSGTFWSGLIDDVRIYKRAITP